MPTALLRSQQLAIVDYIFKLFSAIRYWEMHFGSLAIPVKSIPMINQVNKEYPSMSVILLFYSYYGFFKFY